MITATLLIYYLMRAYIGGSERARLAADPLIVLMAFYAVLYIVRRFSSNSRSAEPQGQ